ncbi:MAG: stage III sporulation protein AB [Oscillospiraceae bacterium]|nr:stage III sporulation protein AB [Oscillospiraceae bacterium]
MTGKLIGAMLVIFGCGGFGFSLAAASKREEASLRQLIGALDYMQCELQYRLTALPELCRLAGKESAGIVGQILTSLALELESQISPDVESCMRGALNRCSDVPKRICQAFQIMGSSLGRFDMEGQIRGMETVRSFCRRELDGLSQNRESRLRSYQTLGLCAGAALAILFV